jgi:hypothetical protein
MTYVVTDIFHTILKIAVIIYVIKLVSIKTRILIPFFFALCEITKDEMPPLHNNGITVGYIIN